MPGDYLLDKSIFLMVMPIMNKGRFNNHCFTFLVFNFLNGNYLWKFQYLARISMNLVGDCRVTLYIMPMSVILWALDDHCISLVNFSISMQSYSNQSPGRNTSYIKCNILIPNWLVFGWKHKSKLLDTASSGNLINLPQKRG